MITENKKNTDDDEIVKITVEYGNGDTKVLEKGAVISFNYEKDSEGTVLFEMQNVSGKDFKILMFTVISAASKLGFFDEKNEDDE